MVITKKYIFTLFLLVTILNLVFADDYEIGIESSMRKVFIKNDVRSFRGHFTNQTTVSLAKNEYESFQLVVKANKNLSKVSVTSEGFNGLVVESNPIGFVEVKSPTKGFNSEYLGWYPDPVLTFVDAVNIDNGDYQPFLVTIYAPKHINPGNYSGKLIISANNSASKTMNVRVTVWDFLIPDKPSLPTAMAWQGGSNIEKIYKDTPSWSKRIQDGSRYILKEEYKYLIEKFRLFPDRIYGHGLEFLSQIFNEKGWIDFSNLVNGPIHLENQNGVTYVKGSGLKLDKFMDEYIARLKRDYDTLPTGMKPYVYTYILDEEPSEFREIAKEKILKRLKTEVPQIKVVLDSWQHEVVFQEDPELEDLFDVLVHWMFWDENAMKAHRDAQERLRPKGKKVWWYITTTSPNEINYHLESDLISGRLLLGMSSAKFHSDGFLYWEIGMWASSGFNKKPIEIIHGSYTDWDPRARGLDWNGDANLILPGPERIIPTLRLVNFRDGMEDFEYYRILSYLSNNSSDSNLIDRAKILMAGNSNIVGNAPIEHTNQPDLVYAERAKLAELIVQLGGGAINIGHDNTPPAAPSGVNLKKK